MSFNTPLRYPGGKGKLTDFIKLFLVQNNLINGEYLEPYAGGAGIALNLLIDGYVARIHLNDLNPAVYAFWHSVLHYPDELCQRIHDVSVSMDEWHKQKNIHLNPDQFTQLELGFSTFFLNRCNRSGILLAGVIGGKNQTGKWKIDARFNKENLTSRIERVALMRDQIEIYNLDSANLIGSVIPTLPENTLIYLDPPYYVKGKGLYQNHYVHDDHQLIANLVQTQITHPWIVSYDHAPEIMELYQNCTTIEYGINYSAQDRYTGAEVMFFKDNLIVPNVRNPSNLKSA